MVQGSGGAVFVPNQTSPVSVPAQLPPISVAASLTSAGSLPQPPSSNSGKGRSIVRSFGMREACTLQCGSPVYCRTVWLLVSRQMLVGSPGTGRGTSQLTPKSLTLARGSNCC